MLLFRHSASLALQPKEAVLSRDPIVAFGARAMCRYTDRTAGLQSFDVDRQLESTALLLQSVSIVRLLVLRPLHLPHQHRSINSQK